jgi:hypothetical protein
MTILALTETWLLSSLDRPAGL